jgi:hypothetical protein
LPIAFRKLSKFSNPSGLSSPILPRRFSWSRTMPFFTQPLTSLILSTESLFSMKFCLAAIDIDSHCKSVPVKSLRAMASRMLSLVYTNPWAKRSLT